MLQAVTIASSPGRPSKQWHEEKRALKILEELGVSVQPRSHGVLQLRRTSWEKAGVQEVLGGPGKSRGASSSKPAKTVLIYSCTAAHASKLFADVCGKQPQCPSEGRLQSAP